MKFYLAGKITGDPEYRKKFAAAEGYIRDFTGAGTVVISPAVLPEGLSKAEYMRCCFAMLDSADAAVFMPDWLNSPGARLEKQWCEYTGKAVIFIPDGKDEPRRKGDGV